MKIDDIRLLRLSRSAPSLLTMTQATPQDDAEVACFSLFDYFDGLVVYKGDNLDYRACFGLDQPTPTFPLVSSEYLTLVSLVDEDKDVKGDCRLREGDPFFGEDGQDLSTLPFLSVMMVTVLPDPLVAPNCKERGVLIRPADVDRFLRTCTVNLRQWTQEACRELYAEEAELQAIYRVYNCINSGNFCLVTRSRSPELTYHVSMLVRAKTLDQSGTKAFPNLDCSTYTLVGLARPEGVAPQTFSKDVASKAEVALRLSVTNKVRNSLFQYAADHVMEELRGLYGRYDVTLRLDMERFGQIYPWISAKKLGHPFPEIDEIGEEDEIVRLLRQSLCSWGVQCINVRLLPHMEGILAPENAGIRRKTRQDEVKRQNAAVTELLQEVAQLGDSLIYCQEEYRTSLCLLKDLWESYSSLRYQDDSFIDGNILLVQVWLLLNTVKRYLGSIQPKSDRKLDYETLSTSLRFAIDSIDHFQKLMLSINQQSMQAPNYEVQMHCDMEKFVVAYTEFSRRFLAEHFRPMSSGLDIPMEKQRQLIFPIITVNTTLNAIQAHLLFLLPCWEEKNELLYSNKESEQLLLSIEIPESGLLGDIYTILPLICHELFHNFRVLDRNERNDELVKYLFRRIAQFIVQRWISQTAEKNIYQVFGQLQDELYINVLADLLWEFYQEQCAGVHKTANIGALITNIRSFLLGNIFNRRETNQLQRPSLTLEQVKGQLDWLCRLALDASGDENPMWDSMYQECRDAFAKSSKEGDAGWDQLSRKLAAFAKQLTMAVADGHSKRVQVALLLKLLEGLKETEREKALLNLFEGPKGPEREKALLKLLEEPKGPEREKALLKLLEGLEESEREKALLKLLEGLKETEREKAPEMSAVFFGAEELRQRIIDAPSLVDQWIIKTDGYWRKLVLLLSKREQFGGSSRAVKLLDHIICDMFRSVKDANHLYWLLVSWDKYFNKPYKREIRDQLIQRYHARIRQNVEKYHMDREPLWLLYSAPVIHELTAPLGGDLKEEEMFASSLRRILLSTAQKDIFEIIDSQTTLYREIFADIGMCVSLGLNAFGYLNVLSCNGAFQILNGMSANLKLDRMRIVSLALIQEKIGPEGNVEAAVEQVRADGRDYAQKLTEHMKQYMCTDELTVQNWGTIWQWIKDLLNGNKKICSVAPFSLRLEIFYQWFRPEIPAGEVHDIYGQLKSLWVLAHLIDNLYKFVDSGMTHSLQSHFSGLLPVIRRQWQEDEKRAPGSCVLQKVGRVYSNPCGISVFLDKRERFRDTLSFVLYYYYHGWSVYGWSDRSNMENWLNSLMGGTPL